MYDPAAPPIYAAFARLKDRENHPRPLLVKDLPFARMMDEIIVPFNTGDTFILDGVSVTRDDIVQIKVVQQVANFGMAYRNLHYGMRAGDNAQQKKVYGDQYHTRLEAVVREGGLDVTPRFLDAYKQRVAPSLAAYVKDKEPILRLAWDFFRDAMEMLGGGGAAG